MHARKKHMDTKVVLQRLQEWSCDFCAEKFYRLKDWHKHAGSHVRKKLSNKENLKNCIKNEKSGEKYQQRSDLIVNKSDTIFKSKSCCDTQPVNNKSIQKFAPESKYDELRTFTKPEISEIEIEIKLPLGPNEVKVPKSSEEVHVNQAPESSLSQEQENQKDDEGQSLQPAYGYSNTYTCGQCPMVFKTFDAMSFHLVDHSGPPYICIKCTKTFESIAARNKHAQKKHKYQFDCSTCHKIFSSKNNLKIHLRVHTGERPYECKVCGKRFTQSAALYTHNKIHLGLKEHVCSYCNKPFTEYHNMKNHERTHTKERPFICEFCKRAFSDPSALKRHKRTHTGDKIYPCEQCHMKFSDASGLIAHKRRHVGVKNFTCEFCSKKFYTRSELAKHESSMHMKVTPFECDECSKRFTLKQYLVSHVTRHHLPRLQCGICKLNFFSNTTFQQHRSQGCVKDKFECDICGIKVAQKVLMKAHMEKKHLQALYCHICLGRFYSDYHLQKHKAWNRCTKKIYIKDIIKVKVSKNKESNKKRLSS